MFYWVLQFCLFYMYFTVVGWILNFTWTIGYEEVPNGPAFGGSNIQNGPKVVGLFLVFSHTSPNKKRKNEASINPRQVKGAHTAGPRLGRPLVRALMGTLARVTALASTVCVNIGLRRTSTANLNTSSLHARYSWLQSIFSRFFSH